MSISRSRPVSGGPEGNERLTATTAAILLALLAAEGVTILFLGQTFSVHQFVGMLLVGPVLLKLASTGYRFVRYYARDPVYRAKGPPRLLLRLLAPLVVASTVVVFGTGVALAIVGPPGGLLVPLHKVSFIVWLAATGIHVLAYFLRLPPLVRADLSNGRTPSIGGEWSRRAALALALLVGLGLALATASLAGPWLVRLD